MGYRLIAVSPDRPEELRKTTKKLDLDYPLLSDGDMAASRALGIAFVHDSRDVFGRVMGAFLNPAAYRLFERASSYDHHQLPVPSVFIVGTDRVIDFAHYDPDYTVGNFDFKFFW